MPIVYGPVTPKARVLSPRTPTANTAAGARLGPGNPNPSILTRAFANQQNPGTLAATGSIGFTRDFKIQFNGPGNPPPGVMLTAALNVKTSFNAVADATAGGLPFIFPPVVPLPAPANASGQTEARLQVLDPATNTRLIDLGAIAGPYSAYARFFTDTPGMKKLSDSKSGSARLQYGKTYQLVVYADSSCSATIGAGARFAPSNGQALIDVDSGGSVDALLTLLETPFELIPNRPVLQLQVPGDSDDDRDDGPADISDRLATDRPVTDRLATLVDRFEGQVRSIDALIEKQKPSSGDDPS